MASKEKQQLSDVLTSIRQDIEDYAKKSSLNVSIWSESFLSTEMIKQLFQPEPVGKIRATFSDKNEGLSFQLSVRVLYDGFGFVGVELFSTPDIIDAGLKRRRAKAALSRVISAYAASIYTKKVKLAQAA
ncbi:hypothetical protein QX249_12810 [Vibrio parahaemolyticus]|uniref:Uncharacterized protein n=1 Tax=Vibrio parahaemolyticus TaxID=670 RepID=A0AAW8PZ84_VIBPH|nr:hypothetical protein [Vibrio parahaemolyticus]EGR2227506.1 hypothetical protein [Vibrio parahaemolyticus]MDS1821546.1 hypothetical protein [Vibrio parahaemolyticus]